MNAASVSRRSMSPSRLSSPSDSSSSSRSGGGPVASAAPVAIKAPSSSASGAQESSWTAVALPSATELTPLRRPPRPKSSLRIESRSASASLSTLSSVSDRRNAQNCSCCGLTPPPSVSTSEATSSDRSSPHPLVTLASPGDSRPGESNSLETAPPPLSLSSRPNRRLCRSSVETKSAALRGRYSGEPSDSSLPSSRFSLSIACWSDAVCELSGVECAPKPASRFPGPDEYFEPEPSRDSFLHSFSSPAVLRPPRAFGVVDPASPGGKPPPSGSTALTAPLPPLPSLASRLLFLSSKPSRASTSLTALPPPPASQIPASSTLSSLLITAGRSPRARLRTAGSRSSLAVGADIGEARIAAASSSAVRYISSAAACPPSRCATSRAPCSPRCELLELAPSVSELGGGVGCNLRAREAPSPPPIDPTCPAGGSVVCSMATCRGGASLQRWLPADDAADPRLSSLRSFPPSAGRPRLAIERSLTHLSQISQANRPASKTRVGKAPKSQSRIFEQI